MSMRKDKLLRMYAKLRGNRDERIRIDILKEIYKGATKEEKKKYTIEIREYIKAVKFGLIDAGDSMLLAGWIKDTKEKVTGKKEEDPQPSSDASSNP